MIDVVYLQLRLVVLCIIATLLAIGGGQTQLAGEEIAYLSNTRTIRNIYLLDVQRKLTKRLSPLRLLDCCLAWSPDGESLAVVSDLSETSAWEIHTVSDMGRQIRQLTRATGIDSLPAWSPDGKQLAFISSRNNVAEIFVMNLDGTGQHPIHALDVPVRITWTNDGQQIQFVTAENDIPGLYSVNATCGTLCTTSVAQPLDPFLFLDPADSFVQIPTGGIIAAAFNRAPSGGYGIYVVPQDASHPPERLTFNSDLNPPSITSNQKLVAFVSGERDAQSMPRQKHVYVLNTECIGMRGSCHLHLKRVAEDVGIDSGISLSADGQWVTFVANWSGSPELYRVRIDGTGLDRLTWNDTVEMLPTWRP